MSATNKVGDLQVWWVPQIPMKSFKHPVASVAEGAGLLRALADYDIFQFENNVKPDYCNAGGLQRWVADIDGDGTPGWEDWYDEKTGEEDPEAWLAATGGQAQSIDAAQTAAYAEGRKDEREEWEALRAQMLTALRRAALALAFASESSPTMRDEYNVVSAAIDASTAGEQP